MPSVINNKKSVIHYSLNEPNKKKKQNIWPITACGVWINKTELTINKKELKKEPEIKEIKKEIKETHRADMVTCLFCQKLIKGIK